jgi:hypothetical protein
MDNVDVLSALLLAKERLMDQHVQIPTGSKPAQTGR